MTHTQESTQTLEPCLSDEIIPDLNNIVRAIEDEGDRCYLGSTNDAERLREIANWLETKFRRIPPASQSDGPPETINGFETGNTVAPNASQSDEHGNVTNLCSSQSEDVTTAARLWWQKNMPASKFVSARLGGDGRVDVIWRDDDESGKYTLPVNFHDGQSDEALVEELAPLLDDALGEPCSYEMAGKIYRAILPIIDRERAAGKREGIEEAAKVAEGVLGVNATAIRALAEKQP